MTRRRRTFLAIAGALVLPFVVLALYLSFSDLSGWRDTVARLASKGMARELTIAGEFKVDLGIVTRVHATDVSLANTEWGSEPSMAAIDRLDGEINLWELLSGSIHLPVVEIEGGRAIFEADAGQGSNWRLGSGAGTGKHGPVRLRIDSIRGRNVDLIFRTTSNPTGWNLVVASLESAGDEGGNHRLTGAGTFGGTDFDISGGFGSFEDLINLMPVEHDLQLRLGEAELRSSGRIARIATLSGLDLRADAVIPNPDAFFGVLGLPATGIPGFTAKATAVSNSDLTQFNLAVNGPATDLRADGTIDSLISPADLDFDLELEGADIHPIGLLFGISDVGHESFDLAGHLAWRGFPLDITGLEARVGENRFTADGRLGAPPLMLETDFHFQGGGPDAAALAALAGLRLPHGDYTCSGRVNRVDNGLKVTGARLTIGPSSLAADGFVGDPPGYDGTELSFETEGPNLAGLGALLDVTLPAEPFSARGRFTKGAGAIDLHEVQATIGEGRLTAAGQVTTVAGMIGTDLEITVEGRDLSRLNALSGIRGLPVTPYRLEGRIAVTNDGYQLHQVSGHLADLDGVVDGLLTRTPGFVGSKLGAEVSGSDLSVLGDLVPAVTLPSAAFRVDGQFDVLETGIGLHDIEVGLGSANGIVDGRIVGLPSLDGTELRIEARGPSLAVADPLIPGLILPDAGFDVSGDLIFTGDRVDLRDLRVTLAGTTGAIDGTIVLGDGLWGSTAEISLRGQDLRSFENLLENMAALDLPDLPTEPFSMTTSLAIDHIGASISSGEVEIGAATASISGCVGAFPGLIGTDLEISAEGPDASIFGSAAGRDVPAAPFQLSGRVGIAESGFLFDTVRAGLGDSRAEFDGTLGHPPELVGTDLAVRAEGSDLGELRGLTRIERLPGGPFSLAGRFGGDPQGLSTEALDLRFGASDLTGELRARLDGKPKITGRLRSNHFRLADVLPPGDESEPVAEAEPGTGKASSGLVIPDDPWNLVFLDLIDADLEWQVGELEVLHGLDRDFEISIRIAGGAVQIDRFRGTGNLGGTITGNATLTPAPEGHRLATEFRIEGGLLNLAGETADPSQYTSVGLGLEMSLTGRSAHEMAASAIGRVSINLAGGIVKDGIIDKVSADFLVTLLEALNPFAKKDPFTDFHCAVLVANFKDGVMTLDPAALQTEKVTVLGDGTIDFATEKLRFDWITKPRKGIGVSASMFTNPYIRLGGTMAKPAIEMKPAQAMASTGLAVATAGLTLIGKGLLDRITSDKNVCENATKKAEKQIQRQTPQ